MIYARVGVGRNLRSVMGGSRCGAGLDWGLALDLTLGLQKRHTIYFFGFNIEFIGDGAENRGGISRNAPRLSNYLVFLNLARKFPS